MRSRTRPLPISSRVRCHAGRCCSGSISDTLSAPVSVVLPSVVLVYFIVVPLLGGSIGEHFPSLVIDLGLLGLGLAVYGSLFALVGAWFKHPLLTGLVFVFGWEPCHDRDPRLHEKFHGCLLPARACPARDAPKRNDERDSIDASDVPRADVDLVQPWVADDTLGGRARRGNLGGGAQGVCSGTIGQGADTCPREPFWRPVGIIR